jgi:hypothetical protein
VKSERRERSQDEADLCARLPALELDDPETAHPDTLGQAALIEPELAAAAADQLAEIGRGLDQHVSVRLLDVDSKRSLTFAR